MTAKLSDTTSTEGKLTAAEAAFERWRRRAGFVLAPIAFALVWWLTRGHLSAPGARLSAILTAVAVLWITESIPLPAAALLGAALAILLGVAPAREVLAPFADPIIFLFIGSFMLARAMMQHRLDRRIALALLSLPGVAGKPLRMLAVLGLATALISMWVSNTATTAMMLPIALGVVTSMYEFRARRRGTGTGTGAGAGEAVNLRDWPFATGAMLMIAYAASIGGIGTPVGSPPNLIAIAQLRELAGVHVGFVQWMMLTLPMLVVMALVLLALLYFLHPPGPETTQSYRVLVEYVAAQRQSLGPWTAGQINTLLAFAVAVVLWVLPGALGLTVGRDDPRAKLLEARLPEAAAAIVAVILLFVLPARRDERGLHPTLSWDQAVRIDWGTILLFGGGMSLGSLMFSTGVADAMGKGMARALGAESLWAITALAIVLGIILSETASNTASATMIIPVVIALAQAAGVDPVPPALGACLGASYGFMLPVSTPPNAIAYGSGLVPITSMMRAGFLFDIIGFFIILLGLRVMCPLVGFG